MSSSRRAARPTMHDVARLAEVSVKTVSRVVNGEPGVAAATESRVTSAIERLGFRRNDSASQLRSGRNDCVGLIVEDLSDPFYSVLTAAVERVARQHQHLLLTGSGEGSEQRERALIDAFLSQRVAGLVVVPAGEDHSWLRDEAENGTALVFVDRPARGLVADSVLTDNESGIRVAVDHLVAYGHRRIGYLGDDPGFWTAVRRQHGFATAAAALGLTVDAVAMGPHDGAAIAGHLRAWTSGPDPVTAVVTGNNLITVETVRAQRALGLDLAMVGFDDFELADLLTPAITVVAQDPAEMGERATRLLFQRLAGDDGPVRQELLPTRLVVRDSSVPPADAPSPSPRPMALAGAPSVAAPGAPSTVAAGDPSTDEGGRA